LELKASTQFTLLLSSYDTENLGLSTSNVFSLLRVIIDDSVVVEPINDEDLVESN
jgi:hypothetical protein